MAKLSHYGKLWIFVLSAHLESGMMEEEELHIS